MKDDLKTAFERVLNRSCAGFQEGCLDCAATNEACVALHEELRHLVEVLSQIEQLSKVKPGGPDAALNLSGEWAHDALERFNTQLMPTSFEFKLKPA